MSLTYVRRNAVAWPGTVPANSRPSEPPTQLYPRLSTVIPIK